MVSVLASLAALVTAQFLPGLLIVKLGDLGRNLEERWVFSAILAGPLAALVYLATLLTGWSALYWVLLGILGGSALVLPWRTRRASGWSRRTRLVLAGFVAAFLLPYLVTTGSLYVFDGEGNLVMDRALQRDVLFHVGVVRSLETSYPPALLSVSGVPIGYHVGYHLQVAAWARFFGIDAIDGLVRLSPIYFIVLWATSAFVLACRFTEVESARLLTPCLVFCAGAGFLFFLRPDIGWWSLVFMDVTLVSIFLTNPLLPAVPLLFCGLALIADYASNGTRGALLACAYSLAFVLVIKMFLGAQVLAALGAGALVRWNDRRVRSAFALSCVVSAPFLFHTFVAAESSNTSVGLRPLEIVRYSAEKVGAEEVVASLAAAGDFETPEDGWSSVVIATLVWVVGFLGLRLLGLAGWARHLWSDETLTRVMAWFVAIGFPVALVFRIAPAEASGLSRLEAQNDVVWFAAQSGILLWFWTATYLARFKATVIVAAVVVLALPATIQHFVHAASLDPDRVGASRVHAAREAERVSSVEDIWLEPLERSRPSLLPYLAGRRVVYDPYVGYDYMFVGRDAIDYRRHAIAQFFAIRDEGYRAWFLTYFEVDFVWLEPRTEHLPWIERLYANDAIELLQIRHEALREASSTGIVTPRRIAMGGEGTPYLGRGFARSQRVARRRILAPGRAKMYLPREAGEALRVTFGLDGRHDGGWLEVESHRLEVLAGADELRFFSPAPESRGLDAIELDWHGATPLSIRSIELEIALESLPKRAETARRSAD